MTAVLRVGSTEGSPEQAIRRSGFIGAGMEAGHHHMYCDPNAYPNCRFETATLAARQLANVHWSERVDEGDIEVRVPLRAGEPNANGDVFSAEALRGLAEASMGVARQEDATREVPQPADSWRPSPVGELEDAKPPSGPCPSCGYVPSAWDRINDRPSYERGKPCPECGVTVESFLKPEPGSQVPVKLVEPHNRERKPAFVWWGRSGVTGSLTP